MFKLCTLIVTGLFGLHASALEVYEWTVDINTGSKHSEATYGSNKYYNEENIGLGVTYGYTDYIDVKVGVFENSYFKTSVYASAVLNKDFPN